MPLGQGSASPRGWKSMFLALNHSPIWHIIYFFTHNPKFSSDSRSESTSGPKLYNIYTQKRDCKWPIPFRREVPFSHDWCWYTYRFIVYMYTWFIWIFFSVLGHLHILRYATECQLFWPKWLTWFIGELQLSLMKTNRLSFFLVCFDNYFLFFYPSAA